MTKSNNEEGTDATANQAEELADMLKNKFGKETVRFLEETTRDINTPSLSTGIIDLDEATGCGGMPMGRIVELFGPEMSGKTTLALCTIAQAQKAGYPCLYIDMEQALNPELMRAIGVRLDALPVAQPESGEDALKLVIEAARGGKAKLIVIDSVAALVTRAELEGEVGDQVIGARARLMSQTLVKLPAILNKSGCTAIFINQLREKIGVMFGNPEVTPGGRALKFFASMRLDVRRRGESIKDPATKMQIGHHMHIKIVKNKLASPFKECEIDLIYGVSPIISSMLPAAIRKGIVTKQGSWICLPNGEKFLGQPKAQQWLLTEGREYAEELLEMTKRAIYAESDAQNDAQSSEQDVEQDGTQDVEQIDEQNDKDAASAS